MQVFFLNLRPVAVLFPEIPANKTKLNAEVVK